MTYQEALEYLDAFVNYERMPVPATMRAVKLARMRQLCQRLGDPQRRFRSLLVAGTNGKGSICAMVYATLRISALRVGLYTSPHLQQLTERIRVSSGGGVTSDGEPSFADAISEMEFAALVQELVPILDEARRGPEECRPTYFEILTAIAFRHFARQQVEVAIVEVGLGGRLDATNILEPSVAILAPIDVDHVDILGHDPMLIAWEKAGIIRPRQVVISAPQLPGVSEVLRTVCEARGVPLLMCGEDFRVTVQAHTPEGLEVSIAGLRGFYQSLSLPLIGRHQAANAAIAVAALEALSDTGIPHALVERGLAEFDWPGRLEIVNEAPIVIMDGAHNPHAAQAVRATLEELWAGRPVHLLIGMSSDKSVEEVGQVLGPLAASVTCTRSRQSRALDASTLAGRLAPFCRRTQVIPDPLDAYTVLLNTVDAADVIVVTGSFYLVGEVRAALRQAHLKGRRDAQAA